MSTYELRPGSRPTVLLTGFGPFPRVPVNATSVLVPHIAEAAARAFPDLRIVSEILPTEWIAAPLRAAELYAKHRPMLALHFGVSHRASSFVIELGGRNRRLGAPDASGNPPASSCISADGAQFLPVNVPARLMVERLRRRGIPAQPSRDAGSYLCNALLYQMLELARRDRLPVRNGFVHLPTNLIDARRPWREPWTRRSLDWQQVIDGGVEIIAACLGRPPREHHHTRAKRVSPSPFASVGA